MSLFCLQKKQRNSQLAMMSQHCHIHIRTGLPDGSIPQDPLRQQFWCIIATMGQLDARLIRPYRRQPWNIAQLCDTSIPLPDRISFLQKLKGLKPCCLERFFSRPFVNDVEEISDILPPSNLFDQLCIAFRCKVSNMEIENNFARALKMNKTNPHNITSLVSKHITAELKLGQRRMIHHTPHQEDHSQDPGNVFCIGVVKSLFFVFK